MGFSCLSFFVPYKKGRDGLLSPKVRTCRDVSLSVLENIFLDKQCRINPRAM